MRRATWTLGLLLLVACSGTGSGGSHPDPSRPPEIKVTYPNPGDQILAQGAVGAVVPQAWSFELSIDGLVIPADQLEVVPQLGQFQFKPRPKRIIERLSRGPHTARIRSAPPDGGPGLDYSWTFSVSA